MARVRHIEYRGRYGGNGVALDGGRGGHGGHLGFFPNFLGLGPGRPGFNSFLPHFQTETLTSCGSPFLSSSPKLLRPVPSSSPTTPVGAGAASDAANHRLRRVLRLCARGKGLELLKKLRHQKILAVRRMKYCQMLISCIQMEKKLKDF
ncbi:hypothetical protein SESBI_00192 [Sesbania bispinosa]|nr:hypothetical protein SESBI_00192 [Sesbania bispinosa]